MSAIVVLALSLMLMAVISIWRLKPQLIDKLVRKPELKLDDSPLPKDEEGDEDLESAMSFADVLKDAPGKDTAPAAVAPQSIFRAYDIRGVVGKTLTTDIARDIGMAIGSEARDRGLKQLVVARTY